MIADVSIRLATLADAADIAAMARDHIEHGLPWGWRPERVARAIRSASTNVAVVGRAGVVVGFGIMSYADDEAHLLLFGVRPARQRRGIGSALLRWLEQVARTAGIRRIRLEARRENVAAREFYGAHGYHECSIEKAMYSGRLDGICFEKWLVNDAGFPGP